MTSKTMLLAAAALSLGIGSAYAQGYNAGQLGTAGVQAAPVADQSAAPTTPGQRTTGQAAGDAMQRNSNWPAWMQYNVGVNDGNN